MQTVEEIADRPVPRHASMTVATRHNDNTSTPDADADDGAVAEPNWSSRFVVGKYLARVVEEHPMVIGSRAGQAALDSARKRGMIEQLLSSSPFWSMKPNELRHLLRGLGGPHAAAADQKMLKSQLIRFVVESEIFHEAKSKAVLDASQKLPDGRTKNLTVAEKAAAAAEASRGSARALAGAARATAAKERQSLRQMGGVTRTSGSGRLSIVSTTSSLEQIEEETPRAVAGERHIIPRGSSKLAAQAFGIEGNEAAAQARASVVHQPDSAALRLVKKAARKVPVPTALKSLQ